MGKKVAQAAVRTKGSSGSTTTARSSGSSSKSSSGSSSKTSSSSTHKNTGSYSTFFQNKGSSTQNTLTGGGSTVKSGSSATKPSSGGTSGSMGVTNVQYGGGSSGSTASYSGSVDYHKQASDAAARGDWGAVEQALAARQAKINAQGGNDRGTSNAQIMAQLRSQYGDSYYSQPSGTQNRVSLAAGEKLPFVNVDGDNGNIYKDKGWSDGVVYLDVAKEAAQRGDLDAAYDALMRRGFKMADTGSLGGGTSQDQAYALIHQLYSQSPGAQQTYQNNLAKNQQALQQHQTQFGLETRPELAYKQFMSSDGKYWIVYDGQGRPAAAKPVSSRLGDGKTAYSQDEIDLMSQYYSGQGDRAELERQLHNLAVARTGNGRMIDQAGNWASGGSYGPVSAKDWTGLPDLNRGQDTAALRALLEQVNAGEVFQTPQSVPVLPDQGNGSGLLTGGGNRVPVGGDYTGSLGGGAGYGGLDGYGDLSGYLRQMYQQNLQAQLAALQAAYEQNVAGYRAHDDLISQTYRARQNEAAGQNDLQRMYMTEMGLGQGLNTGASGQMALAQNAAYQGALADLWAAENRDRAANDLEIRKLGAAYQGDLASAQAQSNSQLAGALYNEAVRQIQAEEARRQQEIENQRWQQQFEYQKMMDELEQRNWQTQWDYGIQSDRQGTAYKMAASMLDAGVMPDSATLSAAGISQGDAQSYVSAVQAALAAQAAKKGSSGGGNRLTLSQALSGAKAGLDTEQIRNIIDGSYGAGASDQLIGVPDIRNIDTNRITNAKPNKDTVEMTRSNGKGTVVTSWQTVVDGVEKGYVSVTPSGNGTYTLTWLR